MVGSIVFVTHHEALFPKTVFRWGSPRYVWGSFHAIVRRSQPEKNNYKSYSDENKMSEIKVLSGKKEI